MIRAVLISIAISCGLSSSAFSQWIKYPTPGIPRTPDGKLDGRAPAPRTADGRPDLSGLWRFTLETGYAVNVVADLSTEEIAPWADTLFRQQG